MKIAIDARMIEHSGIGSVLRGLLPPLLELGHEQGFQFVLLGDREKLQRYLPSLAPEDVAQWRAPVFSLHEQCFPPRLPDVTLWHFFHYNVPTFLRRPFVVTIHDLIPLVARFRPRAGQTPIGRCARASPHSSECRWGLSRAILHWFGAALPWLIGPRLCTTPNRRDFCCDRIRRDA